MLEVYSTNLAVTANTDVVFNNTHLQTNNTAVLSGGNSVSLNVPGIYEVHVNAYGAIAGDIGLQLYADGEALPFSAGEVTTTSSTLGGVAFSAMIPVKYAVSGSFAKLTLRYTGTAGTLDLVHMTVRRV